MLELQHIIKFQHEIIVLLSILWINQGNQQKFGKRKILIYQFEFLPNSILNCLLQDYFSLLGIQKRHRLDNQELTKNFRNLQNQLHPDKFSNR